VLGAIATPGPLNICVRGMIALPGPMHDVASDKTIIGVGSGSGITGGGLDIDEASNVIIQNLNFRNWGDDAINVQDGSTRVWIDQASRFPQW
jgi:pectate lyase